MAGVGGGRGSPFRSICVISCCAFHLLIHRFICIATHLHRALSLVAADVDEATRARSTRLICMHRSSFAYHSDGGRRLNVFIVWRS